MRPAKFIFFDEQLWWLIWKHTAHLRHHATRKNISLGLEMNHYTTKIAVLDSHTSLVLYSGSQMSWSIFRFFLMESGVIIFMTHCNWLWACKVKAQAYVWVDFQDSWALVKTKLPFWGMVYLFWVRDQNGVIARNSVIFQDRPMFSHIIQKVSARALDWCGWT